MYCLGIAIFLYILQIVSSGWISEWMNPVREQIKENPIHENNANSQDFKFGDEKFKIGLVSEHPGVPDAVNSYAKVINPSMIIKMKLLESTLQNAKVLAESLKMQINEMTTRETIFKDTIANGRSGVSAVTVTSMERPPRVYLVRDGLWTLCTGIVQLPTRAPDMNLFHELFSTPRCIGKEIISQQDPCVFNSIIKYETVPTMRRHYYSEDDFLCLKKSFNSTLERYLSVPRQIINNTCTNGVVRSLDDNIAKCGVRVMSEYTYYPAQEYTASNLPLEYCSEDGFCKLIIAWHVSNSSIENFEFLKEEPGFKKFFIKSRNYIEHVI